jgi:MFS transporter, DHA1 family, chloramphenicol resistance protein
VPFAVYILGLAVFAQATSEFMLSGLLPGIARGLHVPIASAGSLTSAFAVGMIVGAPLIALLSRRWPRRRALLGFLAVFVLTHVLGAVTTSFGLLLASRVIAALANAGFLSLAVATAVAMVPPGAKGRATSVLLGGTTIALVAGVPAGALLGHLWGWRSAFWAVAVISLPALVAIVRSVPVTASNPEAPGGPARRELAALRRPRLWVLLLLCAVINSATFCSLTYLAPLITNVTGIEPAWVPVVLALFGTGAFAGVTAGGRLADVRSAPLLVMGAIALLAGWAVFAALATDAAAAFVLAFVQGLLSFAVGSTLISRVLYTAPAAPALASGASTAALNAGAAIGPWLGGSAISGNLGYRSPLWISALLTALALVIGGIAQAAGRAGEPDAGHGAYQGREKQRVRRPGRGARA